MAIDPIGGGYIPGSVPAYENQKSQQTQQAQQAQQQKTASQKTETEKNQISKEDGFVKPSYKPDMEKVNEMKADLSSKTSAFRMMVQGMMESQGGVSNSAMGLLLKIDAATQKKAQEAISENGEWGVEQTANRIVDFAKALTGGDPSKIGAMKSAFESGFKAAEEKWGGKLPEISGKTYDRVQELFKEWENPTTEVITK